MIKAYINTPYKKNRIFQQLKKIKWKEKKQYYRIQDYIMHTENFRKMFVCVRNSICGWK